VARQLVTAFAAELGLTAPDAPWHTARAAVTEPGDALVQVCDALAKVGADVATLSRTEVAEVSVSSAGGSSAMPHKRNPVAAVALRSAGMRAPMLGATLHVASASAVDERPDGAWHAEWPTLQDLLELTLGACLTAVELSQSLTINLKETAANLELSRGAILSERLSIALPPLVGAEVTAAAVRVASEGGDLAGFLTSQANLPSAVVAEITDPANATGLATWLVDTLPPAERP
jgi:3-carboxy-cis,cis-muconate cycloisomerase